MQSDILVAVIAGLVVSMIGFFGKKIWDRRQYVLLKSPRRKILEGEWKGSFSSYKDHDSSRERSAIHKVNVKAGLRFVKMEMTVDLRAEYKREQRYNSDRWICERSVFIAQIPQKNKGINQFGFIILEVGDIPYEVEGKLLGFGAYTKGIITGELSLSKVQKKTLQSV